MGKERPRIESSDAYQELNTPGAKEEMNAELNKLNIPEIVTPERIEYDDIIDEETRLDAEALHADETNLSREIMETEQTIKCIEDLMARKALDPWMQLRSINNILTDAKEIREMAEMLVEKGSEIFKNQDDIRKFRAIFGAWISRTKLKPDTTLGQARDALLRLKEKDESLIARKQEIATRPNSQKKAQQEGEASTQ